MIGDVQRKRIGGSRKEAVIWNEEDVERCGVGMRRWRADPSLRCYDKEVVCSVAMSGDVR